jgi:hypothetical protein
LSIVSRALAEILLCILFSPLPAGSVLSFAANRRSSKKTVRWTDLFGLTDHAIKARQLTDGLRELTGDIQKTYYRRIRRSQALHCGLPFQKNEQKFVTKLMRQALLDLPT